MANCYLEESMLLQTHRFLLLQGQVWRARSLTDTQEPEPCRGSGLSGFRCQATAPERGHDKRTLCCAARICMGPLICQMDCNNNERTIDDSVVPHRSHLLWDATAQYPPPVMPLAHIVHHWKHPMSASVEVRRKCARTRYSGRQEKWERCCARADDDGRSYPSTGRALWQDLRCEARS